MDKAAGIAVMGLADDIVRRVREPSPHDDRMVDVLWNCRPVVMFARTRSDNIATEQSIISCSAKTRHKTSKSSPTDQHLGNEERKSFCKAYLVAPQNLKQARTW
jgi:hypothetical protein